MLDPGAACGQAATADEERAIGTTASAKGPLGEAVFQREMRAHENRHTQQPGGVLSDRIDVLLVAVHDLNPVLPGDAHDARE